MYSRIETALLKKEFWTAFGQYMKPVPSSEGIPINWINYKTSVRHIRFRMDADNKHGYIGIELAHNDRGIRDLYYEQLQQVKSFLESQTREEWIWQQSYVDEVGKVLSRVYTEVNRVSIFRKDDWPAFISFFKQRIIALDNFWANVKPVFEMLE